MEYERIEKGQKSIISPTKLRMKLMGPHNNKKREGSNNNSSRTSPSRLQFSDETEFSKSSLLASKSDSHDEDYVAASITDIGVAKLPNEQVLDLNESANQALGHQCEGSLRENDQRRPQQFRKGDPSMASAHIMRPQEDENLDYDSNASSSSFEFHRARAERSNQNHVSRAYPSRQMPSKWNDAEKWIMSRQNMVMRKNGQGNRMPVRVVPDNNAGYEHNKPRLDPDQSSQTEFPNFVPVLTHEYGGNLLIDQSTQIKDLVDTAKVSSHANTAGGPAIRSVCMRDMGTEMTPIPSQEPSRSVTPVDATTPFRSPTSSLPSTPRGGPREESSLSQDPSKNTTRELTEEEMKAKTRREIVALGVQLGKMNIAAWASKEEENNKTSLDTDETQKLEFEKRASAWEEAEKSKHNARYKREEIRIQAWESQEKAKLEAEMRRIEAKVEQMKAEAEAKMVKKIAMAKQKSEEKRASAETRKVRDAEKTVAEVEYIRETGQIPTSGYKICCGWFS